MTVNNLVYLIFYFLVNQNSLSLFALCNAMVLVLIGIAIGILIVAILIIKATKTPARQIVGINIHCKKCGIRTNGLACPKCNDKFQSFGV
jgi:hypothetical protein